MPVLSFLNQSGLLPFQSQLTMYRPVIPSFAEKHGGPASFLKRGPGQAQVLEEGREFIIGRMHTWGWAEPWYLQPGSDSDEATRWKQGGGCASRAGKGPERSGAGAGKKPRQASQGRSRQGRGLRGVARKRIWKGGPGALPYAPTSVQTSICSLQGLGLGRPLRTRVDRPGSPRDPLCDLTARK